MEGTRLHNAEQAMHAELPSEARAQRVRERLNELFAALFTSAPSSLQSSSKSSVAATQEASKHQDQQREEQREEHGVQGTEDATEDVDGEETLDRNPYRQRLREIYRERDAVASQARELMRQLDASKEHIHGAVEKERQRRQEQFKGDADAAPTVIDLKTILRGRDVDSAELPLLSAFDYLPQPRHNPGPRRSNRPPSFARATTTSTMRIRAQAKRFPAQVQELSEEEAGSKWAKDVVVPPTSKRDWKGKPSKAEQEELEKRMKTFNTKTQGFLRNPRDTTVPTQQMPEQQAAGTKSMRERQAGAEDTTVFRPMPRVLAFTTYDRDTAVHQTLTLVNTSRVSRMLRIKPLKSKHFSIASIKYPTASAQEAIAPGMAVDVTVSFTPEHLGSYKEQIEIIPENGTPFSVDLVGERNPPGLTLEPSLHLGTHLQGARAHIQWPFANTGGDTTFRIVAQSHVRGQALSSAPHGDASINLDNLEALPESFWNADADDAQALATGSFFRISNPCQTLASGKQSQFEVEGTVSQVGKCRDGFVIIFDNCMYRTLEIEAEGEEPAVAVGGAHVLCDNKAYKIPFRPCFWGVQMERTVVLSHEGAVPLSFRACIEAARGRGDDPSALASEDACGLFAVQPTEGTLMPGEELTLRVVCDPKSDRHLTHPHSAAATLLVVADDLPEAIRDTHATLLAGDLQATITSCTASVSPPAIAWDGSVEPNAPASIPIVIHNDSEAPLSYTCEAVVLPTAVLYLSQPRGTIPPLGSQHTSVIIAARAEGEVDATVTIAFDRAAPVALPVTATMDSPRVVVEAASVDFGLLQCGEAVYKDVSIFNCSFVPVTVSFALSNGLPLHPQEDAEDAAINDGMNIAAMYTTKDAQPLCGTFAPAMMMIPSGQSLPVRLSVCPERPGRFSATMAVHVGGRAQPELLPVTATVQQPLCCFTASAISVPRVFAGVPARTTAHIRNLSSLPARYAHRTSLSLVPVTSKAALKQLGAGDEEEEEEVEEEEEKEEGGDSSDNHNNNSSSRKNRDSGGGGASLALKGGLLGSSDVSVEVVPASGELGPGETRELMMTVHAKRPGHLPPHMLVFDVDGMQHALPLAIAADVRGVSLSYETGVHAYTEASGPPDGIDVNAVHSSNTATQPSPRATRRHKPLASPGNHTARFNGRTTMGSSRSRSSRSRSSSSGERRKITGESGAAAPETVESERAHVKDQPKDVLFFPEVRPRPVSALALSGQHKRLRQRRQRRTRPVLRHRGTGTMSSVPSIVVTLPDGEDHDHDHNHGSGSGDDRPHHAGRGGKPFAEQGDEAAEGGAKGQQPPLHVRGLVYERVPAREPVYKLLRLFNHSGIDATLRASVMFFPAPQSVRDKVYGPATVPSKPAAATRERGAEREEGEATRDASTAAGASGATAWPAKSAQSQQPTQRRAGTERGTRQVPRVPGTARTATTSHTFKRSVRSIKASIKAATAATATTASAPAALRRVATAHGVCFLPEEQEVHLPPHGCTTLKVWCYSDVWGEYMDHLVLRGEHLDDVHIPLRAETTGCPLVPLVTGASGLSPLVHLPSLALRLAGSGDANASKTTDGNETVEQENGEEEGRVTTRKLNVRNPTGQPLALVWEAFDARSDDTQLVDVLSRIVVDDPVLPSARDGIVKLRARVHEGTRSTAFSVSPPVAMLFPDQTAVFTIRFAPQALGTYNGFVRAQVFSPQQAGLALSPVPSSKDVVAFLEGRKDRLPPFPMQTLMLDRATASMREPTAREAKQLLKKERKEAHHHQQQQKQQEEEKEGDKERGGTGRASATTTHAAPGHQASALPSQQGASADRETAVTAANTSSRTDDSTTTDQSPRAAPESGPSSLRFVAGVVRRGTLESEATALRVQVRAQAEHPMLHVVGAPDGGVLFELSTDDVQAGRKAHSTSFTLHNPTASRITFALRPTSEFQVGLVDGPPTAASARSKATQRRTAAVNGSTAKKLPSTSTVRGRSGMQSTSAAAGTAGGRQVVSAMRQTTARLAPGDICAATSPVVLEPAQSCSVGIRWAVTTVRALISRAWNVGSPRKLLQERPRLPSALRQSFFSDDFSDTSSTVTMSTTTGLGEGGMGGRRRHSSRARSKATDEAVEKSDVVKYEPTAVTIADALDFTIEGSPEPLRVPVRAVLHLPHLRLQEDKLDFGRSVLGEPLVKTVTLINSGRASCEWDAVIRRTGDRPAAFDLLQSSGYVASCDDNTLKHRQNIPIVFSPTSAQHYSAQLIVTPQYGEPLCIAIVGDGWQDQAASEGITL